MGERQPNLGILERMSFFSLGVRSSFLILRQSMTTMSSQTQQAEKRLSGRAKLSKMLRARPSEARDEHFADLPVSVNVSKKGIYFHTHRRDYYKGMRLFLTFPFTFANDPMNCEYLAEVVRVETLPNDRYGIAVHLIMTV
ncbi:MAG: hypothetical protein WBL50_05285 [Candidatus Acidiferrum sp.]